MNRRTRRALPIRAVRSEATERQAYTGYGNAGLVKPFRRELERSDAWVAGSEERRVNTIPWGNPCQVWPGDQDEHRVGIQRIVTCGQRARAVGLVAVWSNDLNFKLRLGLS